MRRAKISFLLEVEQLTMCLAEQFGIVNPKDQEELALTLNAKKRKIRMNDFVQAMQKADIPDKDIANIFHRFSKKCQAWQPIIQQSFLPKEYQEAYWTLVKERLSRLQIG